MRLLSFGLDKCVHGAYIISLELYDPYSRQFMTNGHVATRIRLNRRWIHLGAAVAPDARQR